MKEELWEKVSGRKPCLTGSGLEEVVGEGCITMSRESLEGPDHEVLIFHTWT